MIDFNQCDPKRCTGRKLLRHGIITLLKVGVKYPGLLLSPIGICTLSPADKQFIEERGFGVVDCSWKQVDHSMVIRAREKYFISFFYYHMIDVQSLPKYEENITVMTP